jgi:hypothetical protein
MGPQGSDTARTELSLAQLLAEPIVQLAMHADGVGPDQVVALVNSARLRLRWSGKGAVGPSAAVSIQQQGLLALNTLPRDARLRRAMEAVRQANLSLRQAEQRFDRDCSCEPMTLIQQVRSAEAALRAARAGLMKLGSGTLDEGD